MAISRFVFAGAKSVHSRFISLGFIRFGTKECG